MKIVLILLVILFLTATVITGIYAVKIESEGLGWLCFGLLILTFCTTQDVLRTLIHITKNQAEKQMKPKQE